MELTVNEAERIAVLYKFGVLDSEFEERFDRLTRIAASLFNTPISLISLVDANRQWFKSSYGLNARQTPRDISFCTHAISGNDVFIVPDAKKDNRFSDNPPVTGDPNIRFYAGAPLVTHDGHALGTFCVIDNKPRTEFTPAQQQVLKDLADTVIDSFEMNNAMRNAQAYRLQMEREMKKRLRAMTGGGGY